MTSKCFLLDPRTRIPYVPCIYILSNTQYLRTRNHHLHRLNFRRIPMPAIHISTMTTYFDKCLIHAVYSYSTLYGAAHIAMRCNIRAFKYSKKYTGAVVARSRNRC